MTRTSQKDGGPIYQETTTLPADRTLGAGSAQSGQGRITDVGDEDEGSKDVDREQKEKEYEERMEDEYAKREGGA